MVLHAMDSNDIPRALHTDAAGNQYVLISDGTTTAGVDSTSSALTVIELEHHKIHEGDHFFISDYDVDVDIAAPKYWHVIAPNTAKRIHLVYRVISSLNGILEVFENPTTTNNGTGLTEYNSDRNSAVAATLATYFDPVVTVDGTRLFVEVMGSDGAAPIGIRGGKFEREREFILKQNEQYLFKFTAATNDNRVSINLEWYEV